MDFTVSELNTSETVTLPHGWLTDPAGPSPLA